MLDFFLGPQFNLLNYGINTYGMHFMPIILFQGGYESTTLEKKKPFFETSYAC